VRAQPEEDTTARNPLGDEMTKKIWGVAAVSLVAVTVLSAGSYRISKPGKKAAYIPVMDANTKDLTLNGNLSASGLTAPGDLNINSGSDVQVNGALRPSSMQLPSWSVSTIYAAGDVVLRGGTIYIARDAHTSSSVFGTDWVAGSHWKAIPPYPGSVSTVAGPCPSGTFLADGSSKSRVTYADLYAVVGTAHGTLDANSFNLPDYRGRFLRGADATNIVGTVQDDATSKNGLALTGTVSGGVATLTGSIKPSAVALTGSFSPDSMTGTMTFATGTHKHAIFKASGTTRVWGDGTALTLRGAGGTTAYYIYQNTGYAIIYTDSVATTAAASYTSPTKGTLALKYTAPTNGNIAATTVPASNGNIAIGPGDTETRPINTAVNYCIEY